MTKPFREVVRRLDDGSRMNREVHVRFYEGLGLQCPGLLTGIEAAPAWFGLLC